MTDYGHDLLFGTFLTPTASAPERVVALAQQAEQAGLDLVTFQDHPYQPTFLDTWTLLSWVGAVTSRIRIAPNVANLPLRPPAVLARSAASLDRLTGGRVDLGIGAGGFWDAIAAMGGPRRTPGQGVDALAEAITVIRALWDVEATGRLDLPGEHYPISGAKRGPAPAHPIPLWIGAYKPRMLRLTGTMGDGWLPSMGYLTSLADLTEGNRRIDDAAQAAGRPVTAVRRLLNLSGQLTGQVSDRLLVGPPEQWVEQLAVLALQYGISGFVVATDDPTLIDVVGQDIAPAVRELVEAER
ncbi:LLM class flavin-dependent oxidoreductase [Cellulomonas taurus]|uniref:LLM class flavin-dependent oxidoreductase n=1 Tax=Cellulomonas taurus TaxID=2729175 RepID=UPI00145DECBF|nr:LLM class flavin-dependent oxidoreductase [Cellulomonas taurus]